MLTRLLSILIGLIPFLSLHAQDKSDKIPEPEYMNELYYLSDSNMLKVVENGEAVMKTKTKLGGFGGSSTEYIVSGAASPFRTSNAQPSFIIKMGSMMMMDPSSVMILYKFDKKDKQRSAMLSKVGVMGKGSGNNQQGINYRVKQTSDGVYVLIPEKPLGPGEYGFINMMMPKNTGGGRGGSGYSYGVFAFGIDQ